MYQMDFHSIKTLPGESVTDEHTDRVADISFVSAVGKETFEIF